MVEILRVDPEEPGRDVLSKAGKVLLDGGLVIYPTDTLYGLGADPFNANAVKKVFEAKRRGRKPLPLIASGINVVKRFFVVSEFGGRIIRRFWPGPVTLVLRPRNPEKFRLVTLGVGGVAVRVPSVRLPRLLAGLLGGFIVATSANISGAPPPRTVWEAVMQVGKHVSLALDGGPSPQARPSTIVDVTGSKPRLVREGVVPFRDILAVD